MNQPNEISPNSHETVSDTPVIDSAIRGCSITIEEATVVMPLIDAARKLERKLAAHAKEREEFIQSALAREKKADEDRNAYESLIEELKAQLSSARTQCGLRSAGHDDLRTKLNQANGRLSALQSELATAKREREDLQAKLFEWEQGYVTDVESAIKTAEALGLTDADPRTILEAATELRSQLTDANAKLAEAREGLKNISSACASDEGFMEITGYVIKKCDELLARLGEPRHE